MQAARVWSSVWRNAITKTTRRNYGGGHNHRHATLNEMPVPEGDFMALHAKRQRMNHTVLAIGVCSVSFALFLYKQLDVCQFHYNPPRTYE